MNVQLYGYVRVSTRDQNEERQVIAMRDFGVPTEGILVEKMSGKNFDRPIYQNLVSKMKPGDVLVIKSLDRLGRNYDAVIEEWKHLTKSLDVAVVVLDMPLLDTRKKDHNLTATFISDVVLQVLSYVAETEREFCRQRQAEGIAVAKANGVKFGKQPLERPTILPELREKWQRGEITSREGGKLLGISHTTFLAWIKDE